MARLLSMSIHFEHAIEVACPPANAFAVLDDVSQTPKWLARCTGIEKLSPGENAVGTKLRYSFREGGRTGVMDGETIERKQNERLKFRYDDKMMGVTVDIPYCESGRGDAARPRNRHHAEDFRRSADVAAHPANDAQADDHGDGDPACTARERLTRGRLRLTSARRRRTTAKPMGYAEFGDSTASCSP